MKKESFLNSKIFNRQKKLSASMTRFFEERFIYFYFLLKLVEVLSMEITISKKEGRNSNSKSNSVFSDKSLLRRPLVILL